MSDVRLTATNPVDSSVVPVACNEKGELKLEEPILVEGPQGEKGDKGDPGDPFSGNFADDVSFGGTATFAGDVTINSILVGRGGGSLDSNTAVGDEALNSNTEGGFNTAVGQGALITNTAGSGNTAVGQGALYHNTVGGSNTAVGTGTLVYNVEGEENIAVGQNALVTNTAGSQNTAVGVNASFSNTTGNLNTAIGLNALYHNTEGDSNTCLGRVAGGQIKGSNNTFIGQHQGAAGLSNTLSLSTGETERMRIGSDDAVDFNQKCGFTSDGGLWITDQRGNKWRTSFGSNDFMQWEAYEYTPRSEPQLSALDLKKLQQGQNRAN